MADAPGGYRVIGFDHRRFALLEEAWRALEKGRDMSAFQSFEWMLLANEHAAAERAARLVVRTRYYLVERAGIPVLIAPLRVHLTPLSPGHRRGVHLVGRNGPADYLNLVYSEFDAHAAGEALSAAVKDFGVSAVRWERMLVGTEAQQWASGLAGAEASVSEAVHLVLPASPAEYSALLSKSTRQNIRTAWNRARSDGVHLDVSISSELGAAEADALAGLKRRREASRQPRKASAVDRLAAVFRRAYFASLFAPYDEACQGMTRTAQPWVLRVVADGVVCAFAFGLGDLLGGRRTLRLLQVGIDENFARYSPGLIGLHRFILEELEQGRPHWDLIDFTRGEERYKFQLGGVTHPYVDVSLGGSAWFSQRASAGGSTVR